MQHFLNSITDLGDSGWLIALSFCTAGSLVCMRCYKGAAALMLALFGAGALIATLKLVFLSCGAEAIVPGLRSPSGHAALSLAVIGTLSLILTIRLPSLPARVIEICAALLVAAIAYSRVRLGFHTILEVAAGLVVGVLVLLANWNFLHRGERLPPFDPRLMALSLLLAIPLYGMRLQVEPVIRFFALDFGKHVALCKVS